MNKLYVSQYVFELSYFLITAVSKLLLQTNCPFNRLLLQAIRVFHGTFVSEYSLGTQIVCVVLTSLGSLVCLSLSSAFVRCKTAALAQKKAPSHISLSINNIVFRYVRTLILTSDSVLEVFC